LQVPLPYQPAAILPFLYSFCGGVYGVFCLCVSYGIYGSYFCGSHFSITFLLRRTPQSKAMQLGKLLDAFSFIKG
jgi:hypothetical protein